MNSRKIIEGIVSSNKMQKSITIQETRSVLDPKYKKRVKKTKKYMAHDEKNVAKIGDLVRIEESRPLSKKKRWTLLEVVKGAVK